MRKLMHVFLFSADASIHIFDNGNRITTIILEKDSLWSVPMMTFPMILTLARLVCAVPAVFVSLSFEEPSWLWVETTLLVFGFFCATDYLDGWAARVLGQESKWGRVLDPVTDKVFVIGTLLAIASMHDVSAFFFWFSFCVVVRELLVSGLREGFTGEVPLSVTRLAKWKTALQMFALGFLIVMDALETLILNGGLIKILGVLLVGAAWYNTLVTGLDYLRKVVCNNIKNNKLEESGIR